ncbi:unnamed protein product [Dovyalis caffra]|uniref:Uncharacterized protein n=1 Tax=Dovyalis caffra TaxID=77055 RepID=A0AAV1RUL2_9ROSI|nr:unnamed protein product [Dovyalis caffra]
MIKQFNRGAGHEWVIHIKRTLDEGIDDEDLGIPACIFSVPKALVSTKQEAYIPQLVAIGPYHHRRVELFEMERKKLVFAERIQKKFHNITFSDIVGHLEENVSRIRACYHAYLDFDREELAWTFAIDASFLLVCLQAYKIKHEDPSTSLSASSLAQLVDLSKKKTIHHVILRDVVMSENQIPLFVLREVNRLFQYENPDEVLASMLMKFCTHLSPIKIMDSQQQLIEECLQKNHLLDLLYCMVAPKLEEESSEIDESKEGKENLEEIGCFKKAWKFIWSFLCFIVIVPIRFLVRIRKSKAVKVAVTLPWQVIKQLCHLNTKSEITNLVSTARTVAAEIESVSGLNNASLLIEEFSIPSAEKLSGIGVIFIPTIGGLKTIRFDKPSGAFYLPVVDLDDNSEVLLRNLVAYEACLAPECTVFARYIRLMSGILDTKEDVKILRDSGIVLNRLKSDEEAANLWHGIDKFVNLTKVPIIDKAIEDANTYYSKNWKVRLAKCFNKYVYGSRPILTFLAANILILLSAFEAFCSVYNCSK